MIGGTDGALFFGKTQTCIYYNALVCALLDLQFNFSLLQLKILSKHYSTASCLRCAWHYKKYPLSKIFCLRYSDNNVKCPLTASIFLWLCSSIEIFGDEWNTYTDQLGRL